MSETQNHFEFRLPVFQIDDDGDLKFIFYYNTEILPAVSDTIVNMIQDDSGKFVRRIYYKIVDILFPVRPCGKNSVVPISENPVIHVKVQVDEPVLDGV